MNLLAVGLPYGGVSLSLFGPLLKFCYFQIQTGMYRVAVEHGFL